MSFNTLKTFILAVSLLVLVASCKKDTVIDEYKRSGNSIAVSGSNLVIAGYTTSSLGGYDASLILASQANGDTIFNRKFGGSYADAFYSVKKSHEGGFIAAGFSNRASSNSPAMFVVITDANGNQLKSIKYGASDYSQCFSVLPTANADSGYLLAGYIQKSSSYDKNIFLVRIDNAGVVKWEKSIGATSTNPYDTVNESAYTVISAPDGGYFLTGSINGYSTCCGKIFLMKVSSMGDSLWTKTFNYGIGYSLTLTSDGGVAIGGTLQETANQDIILIKTDTAGNLAWKKTFSGTGYEYGATMVETSDGGFAISGITDSKGAGYQDVYLLRTNSTGSVLWDHTYGGNSIDQGFGLVQLDDGGFALTGLSNTGGSFIFLNRTSSDGTQQWIKYIQ
ncbi:MAG: hypothetical protein WCR72_08975 [Bacteroidota bacterium]